MQFVNKILVALIFLSIVLDNDLYTISIINNKSIRIFDLVMPLCLMYILHNYKIINLYAPWSLKYIFLGLLFMPLFSLVYTSNLSVSMFSMIDRWKHITYFTVVVIIVRNLNDYKVIKNSIEVLGIFFISLLILQLQGASIGLVESTPGLMRPRLTFSEAAWAGYYASCILYVTTINNALNVRLYSVAVFVSVSILSLARASWLMTGVLIYPIILKYKNKSIFILSLILAISLYVFISINSKWAGNETYSNYSSILKNRIYSLFMAEGINDGGLNQRKVRNIYLYQIFEEDPWKILFGNGVGNWDDFPVIELHNQLNIRSHNSILNLVHDCGIIYALLYIIFLYKTIIIKRNRLSYIYFIVFIYSCFYVPILSSEITYWFLGVVHAMNYKK